MRKLSVRIFVMGLLVLGGLWGSAFAQVTNSYDLGVIAVWDISGNYSNDTLSVEYALSQDGKGKITGVGSTTVSNAEIQAEMPFKIKGHIKTHNKTTSLQFVMKTGGKVESEGETYSFKVKGVYKADVNPNAKKMTGSIKASVKIGDEEVSLNEKFTEDLPAGMDGSAALTVIYQATEKNIIGTGVLTLSNGTELNYTVKGKLNAKKGEGSFKLTGVGTAKGSRIQITTDLDYNLLRAKGRVMGQKIEL